MVEDGEFKQVFPVRQVFHTSLCLIDTYHGKKCISVNFEFTHCGVVWQQLEILWIFYAQSEPTDVKYNGKSH